LRIFITGGGGYIGTTLVPYLLRNGHDVTVLDRFFFGEDLLSKSIQSQKTSGSGRYLSIRGDTRYFDGKILKGMDAVVDLAALSNDPSGELDPWKTMEINFLGRSRVARLSKEASVKKYLLVSSCSIYGFQEGLLTEKSKTNPLTTYAKANMLAEDDNLRLGDDSFTSSAIRFATVYGLSERMRFDLAINGMVLGAIKNGKIPLMRDGTQWRPFIHVKDASRAILCVLEAESAKVNRELFNMGSDSQNYQIKRLAELVSESVSDPPPEIQWYGDPDNRSYKVSFAKAKGTLGFDAKYTPKDAVIEIKEALTTGKIDGDSLMTRTVEWYKHLLTDPEASKRVLLEASSSVL
jgi:nucleoside-diphosphate-sugar epimerase